MEGATSPGLATIPTHGTRLSLPLCLLRIPYGRQMFPLRAMANPVRHVKIGATMLHGEEEKRSRDVRRGRKGGINERTRRESKMAAMRRNHLFWGEDLRAGRQTNGPRTR